jgi:hypothetical protein
MRRGSTIFLQIVIVAIAIGILAFLIIEPNLEGRNANSTLFEVYFKDPFLAYIYIASIAVFIGLYQAFKILGYVRQDKVFSQQAVKALRTIKYCGAIFIAFVLGAEAYIVIFQSGKEDIAGGVAMGVMIIFITAVTAVAAAMFERLLQNAVDIKSENDLTV